LAQLYLHGAGFGHVQGGAESAHPTGEATGAILWLQGTHALLCDAGHAGGSAAELGNRVSLGLIELRYKIIVHPLFSPVKVLYDRAPSQFHPIDLPQKHELFLKLSRDYPQFQAKDTDQSDVLEATALTQKMANGSVQYKPQRQAVLVSSTSWTPDEDFGILLKALHAYESKTKFALFKISFMILGIY